MTYAPPSGQQRVSPDTGRKRLPTPRWTGDSAAALLHAATGVLVGVALIVEPRQGGYTFPVFTGVRSMMAFAGVGREFTTWGLLFLVPSLVVLIGRGKPWTLWPLIVLAAAWGAWAGGSLYVGITSANAASIGGIAWASLALSAWRVSAALGRRIR